MIVEIDVQEILKMLEIFCNTALFLSFNNPSSYPSRILSGKLKQNHFSHSFDGEAE